MADEMQCICRHFYGHHSNGTADPCGPCYKCGCPAFSPISKQGSVNFGERTKPIHRVGESWQSQYKARYEAHLATVDAN